MDARRRGLALVLGLVTVTAAACRREPTAAAPPFVVDARAKSATLEAQPPAATAPPTATAPPAAAPPPTATPPTGAQPTAAAQPPAAIVPEPPGPGAAVAGAAGSVEYATVEISGTLELPPGSRPKEPLVVFITTRDCLNDASPLIRRVPVTDDRAFFAAVMVAQGSTLSVCAAAEPAPGKPAHLYGRAGTLPIQKTADQTFRDLKITLAEDSPRQFPTQLAR